MQHDIRAEPHGGDGWRAMVALRHRVLRAPLGLAFTDAQLAAESDQLHLALRLADHPGQVIGTLLLQSLGSGRARLRQMAVDPAFAGQGLGGALLARAETEALALGLHHILLSSRETAIGFYQRHGYHTEGDRFTEVTLPHQTMRKHLARPGRRPGPAGA